MCPQVPCCRVVWPCHPAGTSLSGASVQRGLSKKRWVDFCALHQGVFPNSGIEPVFNTAGRFFTHGATWEAQENCSVLFYIFRIFTDQAVLLNLHNGIAWRQDIQKYLQPGPWHWFKHQKRLLPETLMGWDTNPLVAALLGRSRGLEGRDLDNRGSRSREIRKPSEQQLVKQIAQLVHCPNSKTKQCNTVSYQPCCNTCYPGHTQLS